MGKNHWAEISAQWIQGFNGTLTTLLPVHQNRVPVITGVLFDHVMMPVPLHSLVSLSKGGFLSYLSSDFLRFLWSLGGVVLKRFVKGVSVIIGDGTP